MIRAHHPEYGWGVVQHVEPTELFQISQPPVLIFIRWEDTRGHGVAGGWYSGEGPEWIFENAAELVTRVNAALELREEAAKRAHTLGVVF